METIAIIGAGFAGLAAAWHLQNRGAQIHLYDHKGIGGGASGMAAGLLHPFAGLHAKLNWHGFEGMESALRLIDVAERQTRCPVADRNGILRIAQTDAQEKDYARCAAKYFDQVTFLNSKQCKEWTHGFHAAPAIFIRTGLAVYSLAYLSGLWLACKQRGALLYEKHISHLADLKDYDAVVIATGAGTQKLFPHLPVTHVKGQILEIQWPRNLPSLPQPVNSQVYAVMAQDKQSCFIGATYERDFDSEQPDLFIAEKELLERAKNLFPKFPQWNILRCLAGVRVSTPNHLPFIKEVDSKTYLLTGFGSKGLLYHAWMAEQLASLISTSR